MAACIVEDASGTTSVYSKTTDTMQQTPSPSSSSMEAHIRKTTSPEHHRCSFDFHTKDIGNDSALIRNRDSARKRQRSRTDTWHKICRTKGTTFSDSSRSQTDSGNKHKDGTVIPSRPKSLFLTNVTNDHPLPLLRTCLSHPSISSSETSVIKHDPVSLSKFKSLPELSSSPTKCLCPDTLTFQSMYSLTSTTPVTSKRSLIRFIGPTELADKLREKNSLTIFDCGSPLRHSEYRIQNSTLLRVADKISRKRLKSHPKHYSTIDVKQLNESQFIILYDDSEIIGHHCTNSSFVHDEQLSPALKCAYGEIQRYLTRNFPPILVLNSSFNQFLDLYPNLCETLQPRSCPSSPTNHDNDSSSPQTAPPMPNSCSLITTTTPACQNIIDNHPMTHIIDGIYIGSESNAKNLDELSFEQIRHIVNVTTHVPLYHSGQFRYCHIPVDDSQKQNLLEYFDQAYSFIHHAIDTNEKVLVHCVAGISRSPAIVIGFLMRHTKMSMHDAYDFVKRKRSIISPNFNFLGQLLEYEKTLKQEK